MHTLIKLIFDLTRVYITVCICYFNNQFSLYRVISSSNRAPKISHDPDMNIQHILHIARFNLQRTIRQKREGRGKRVAFTYGMQNMQKN